MPEIPLFVFGVELGFFCVFLHRSHKCYCFIPASFIAPAQPSSGSGETCPIYSLLKLVRRVHKKSVIGPGAEA